MSVGIRRNPEDGSLINVDGAPNRSEADRHGSMVDIAGGRSSKPTTPYDENTKPIETQSSDVTVPHLGLSATGALKSDDPMADPPVGWLVIVDGPGKGRFATLGMGNNSIGRDARERIALTYGDQTISRTNHGAIVYDPRGRKFFVQPGSGTNLTYVNDDLVLTPRELEPFAHVQMGNTVLRFVPLCGPQFSWPVDREQADGA